MADWDNRIVRGIVTRAVAVTGYCSGDHTVPLTSSINRIIVKFIYRLATPPPTVMGRRLLTASIATAFLLLAFVSSSLRLHAQDPVEHSREEDSLAYVAISMIDRG